MKSRFFPVSLLIILLASLNGTAQARTVPSIDPPALVYVRFNSPDDITRFAITQLPMYARLENGLLTGANLAAQQELHSVGLSIQVVDPELQPGTYYIAQTRSSRPAADLSSIGRILLILPNSKLLSLDPSKIDTFARAGVELQAISLTPKVLPTAQTEQIIPELVNPNPVIQGMIDQVSVTQVYTYDKQLAGQLPVWVDGTWYTIPTRYTYSNTPIRKTTYFVGQHMANLGLSVEYHQWGGVTYPNVIGEITGSIYPDDIYIIGAHIDDVSGTPGADDNASGSVATLLAADILSQYQWGCTLRFAYWTGEEQGLLGSEAYAQRAYQRGENILGYLNLDMIAWNTLNSPPYINLFYSNDIPASYQLALLYQDVIDAYNINLFTRLGIGITGSDHYSFWMYDYNSILAIEDDLGGDFNPYYHGPGDIPSNTDPVYFTNFVKASLATFAHMSNCLISEGDGHMDGHVIVASDETPIQGARVVANNGRLNLYPSITDASGYYTMTLPADTYTVTVSAKGFEPIKVGGVQVITNTTTTLDFDLQPVCDPVAGLDFTWVPMVSFSGEPITFTATSTGTWPVDFEWSFGDSSTGSGASTTHAFAEPGVYPVTLTASNACGAPQDKTKDIDVALKLKYFLPIETK